MIQRSILAALFCVLISAGPSTAVANDVEPAFDLQRLYSSAEDQRVLLLLVSQPGCHYCEQIREDILQPMLASGLYDKTTLIREIKIYAGKSLRDFNGKEVDATGFAKRYNAWATPTLLFLNRNGEEIAEKMVGINTPEFYGYYVDKSLETAQASLSQ